MELPEIGEMITTKRARELCLHFGFDHLVERIDKNTEEYKEWEFDGCSGIPDEYMRFFTGCDWRDITYKCCLPHDLEYAYGELGDSRERLEVDRRLYKNLMKKAFMKKEKAEVFFRTVRVLGKEKFGFNFSWGFAHDTKRSS